MISSKSIEEIQEIIKYKFKNKQNLKNSLSHPSINKKIKVKKNIVNEFERLEFLGDRVLGIVVASLLFNEFKNLNEGDLTKKFSFLVQKDFLYKISIELNLEKYLNYRKQSMNININKSIFSDSLEAIIGAIYVDGGFANASKIISRIWTPYLNTIESNQADSKTKLQEISQKKYKKLPIYKLLNKKGPPHSPIFTVSLKVLNLKTVKASAGSIRDAEKLAAKIILESINEI